MNIKELEFVFLVGRIIFGLFVYTILDLVNYLQHPHNYLPPFI